MLTLSAPIVAIVEGFKAWRSRGLALAG
jgi:hypothetical protein